MNIVKYNKAMLKCIYSYLELITGNTSTQGESEVVLTCQDTGIKFIKKGCYHDPGGGLRTLPTSLANHRHKINWAIPKWKEFLAEFSCE